ncbi:MAG: hypothetical protein AAGF25_11705 [Pseudomonadota bacterium]
MTIVSTHTNAQDRTFDAGFVMSEMPTKQRFAFVNGVLQGLAYARFRKDRPDEKGMTCIQQWLFSKKSDRWKTVEDAFNKYQDKPPAVLLHLLAKKECGE